jgi:Ca-activated chloride channel family protein
MRRVLVVLVVALAATSQAQSRLFPQANAGAEVRASTASKLLPGVAAPSVIDPLPALPEPRRVPDPAALYGSAGEGKPVVDFPLKHTKVMTEVSGNIARVEVQQLYENPSKDRLEAVYQFPLPQNAAVTDMYFRIGKRIVYSEVKKKAEQERPNLFTQSVANIPPEEKVAVVLRFVHEVPFEDGRYVYHFPITIGPRYIPGTANGRESTGTGWAADTDRVPDASKVTPPVVNPAFRSAHDIDIIVRLFPGSAFDGVASKFHRIVTGLDGGGARLVALAEDDRVPNKDFILVYRPAGAMPEIRAVAQREKGDDYLMLFMQPPNQVKESMVRAKEMVFLLDVSGSMSGFPVETSKKLVAQALERMGADDTFQIVAFEGGVRAMSPAPLPNTRENVAQAKKWLSALYGAGGTEMLEGIRAALGPPEDPKRLRMVVFCTDGFIGNETEIVAAVEALRGRARVFGFGIGSSVNRFLIDGVARAGRGASDIVGYQENPEEVVARLFRRLDRPILTDLSLSFEGMTVTDVYPQRLPDLFAGQPLVIVGRYLGGGVGSVVLEGRLGSQAYKKKIPLEVVGDRDGAPVMGTLWARRRIDDLTFRKQTGPGLEEVDEIVKLALKFKLVTQYTSFVAVEKELLADPNLPLTEMLVPNEMPDGVKAEGIFGESNVNAAVLPARVKPGDPELRVKAPPTVGAVKVTLPFGGPAREAVYDPETADFVLRFLVPSAWPDGSWDALIELKHDDGRVESRVAAIRVDTNPAAVVVLDAPASVKPGETFRLHLKPALPMSKAVGALTSGAQGGVGHALKGAMDVKEILVRAPWGEIQIAEMDGPLGSYAAELTVPSQWAQGAAQLEIAASDSAGNVTRRTLDVSVGAKRDLVSALVSGLLLFGAGVVGWARGRVGRSVGACR